MGDSNRARLSYGVESTWGTHAGGTLKDLRYSDESLGQDDDVQVSPEIRADRLDADIGRLGVSSSGGINGVLSGRNWDDFFGAILYNDVSSSPWSAEVTVNDTSISVTAGSGTYAIADSNSGFGSVAVGDWVRITGFSNAVNNGIAKVTAAAAGAITVAGNGNGTNESASASVTIEVGEEIITPAAAADIVQSSFTFERHYQDFGSSNEFAVLLGCVLDTLEINASARTWITVNLTFLCAEEDTLDTSGGSGYTAAPTREAMSTSDNVLSLIEGGTTLVPFTEFSATYNGNHRDKPQAGQPEAVGIGSGSLGLSGTLRRYYTDVTQIAKAKAFTQTSLALVVKESGTIATTQDAYVFEFPHVRVYSPRRVAGGKNQDIIAELNWMGVRSSTAGYAAKIVRWQGS